LIPFEVGDLGIRPAGVRRSPRSIGAVTAKTSFVLGEAPPPLCRRQEGPAKEHPSARPDNQNGERYPEDRSPFRVHDT